ncbi:hypothetical protein, partial [Nocardia farcinica]|uniref:hypothetical protein n=1 Tax=Nocardia farcinica TaxID=37329 RepID=UPI002454E468
MDDRIVSNCQSHRLAHAPAAVGSSNCVEDTLVLDGTSHHPGKPNIYGLSTCTEFTVVPDVDGKFPGPPGTDDPGPSKQAKPRGESSSRAARTRGSNDQNLWIPGGRAFPEDDRRSHRILIKTSVGALAGRHARAHGSTR